MFDIKEAISELARAAAPPYAYNRVPFVPGQSTVLYSGPYWDHRELEMAMEALLTGSWLVAGEYVARFQNEFARRFNVKHAHMVNSGSSANLAMIAALKKYCGWKDGDEIIVSPVGFPTTIAPLVQCGLKPVFLDIEWDTLNFDLNRIDEVTSDRTCGIFVSPVLGNPPNMDDLQSIAHILDVPLIGDNCDSLGSKWDGKLLNELYFAWSTSFYPAHHIATGEGGMICSNNKEVIDTARSISWWGRDCYCVGKANLLPCGTCKRRFDTWLGGDTIIDHKYVFTNMGYNLKPLDLQGAIGLAQLEKLDEIESKRRANFQAVADLFDDRSIIHVADTEMGADPCWFGVPVICDAGSVKQELVAHLEANKVQTRSYFAGNILSHPGYKHLGNAADYPEACDALRRVFFLGCPPHYTPEIIQYIGEVLCRFH